MDGKIDEWYASRAYLPVDDRGIDWFAELHVDADKNGEHFVNLYLRFARFPL